MHIIHQLQHIAYINKNAIYCHIIENVKPIYFICSTRGTFNHQPILLGDFLVLHIRPVEISLVVLNDGWSGRVVAWLLVCIVYAYRANFKCMNIHAVNKINVYSVLFEMRQWISIISDCRNGIIISYWTSNKCRSAEGLFFCCEQEEEAEVVTMFKYTFYFIFTFGFYMETSNVINVNNTYSIFFSPFLFV